MYSKKLFKFKTKPRKTKKIYKSSNAIWNPITDTWIELGLNSDYLSKFKLNKKNRLTYITNRTGIDKRCNRLGMIDKTNTSMSADFVQYDTFSDNTPRIGKVMNLPRETVVNMSNKYMTAKLIRDSNNGIIMPKTFLDLNECIQYYNDHINLCTLSGGGINNFFKTRWYLKNIVGVDSNDVHRYNNINDLINEWKSKKNHDMYLAQKEIISVKLKPDEIPLGSSNGSNINYDSKFVARVYIMLTKGPKWYLHKEIYLRCAKYNTSVIGTNTPLNNARTDFYCKASDWKHYPKILESIKKVVAGIALSFKDIAKVANSDICIESVNKKKCHYCHLFGLDIGIEPDYNAKLIEISVKYF